MAADLKQGRYQLLVTTADYGDKTQTGGKSFNHFRAENAPRLFERGEAATIRIENREIYLKRYGLGNINNYFL